MLLTRAKNHYSYPILDNGISSFRQSFNNNSNYYHQHYHSESSSPSLTDPNYLQNQGSNLHTIIETQTKELPKSPYIKRILIVCYLMFIVVIDSRLWLRFSSDP